MDEEKARRFMKFQEDEERIVEIDGTDFRQPELEI